MVDGKYVTARTSKKKEVELILADEQGEQGRKIPQNKELCFSEAEQLKLHVWGIDTPGTSLVKYFINVIY